MEEQQSYFGVLERNRNLEHPRRMNTNVSMSNPESCVQESVSNYDWIHESGSLSSDSGNNEEKTNIDYNNNMNELFRVMKFLCEYEAYIEKELLIKESDEKCK